MSLDLGDHATRPLPQLRLMLKAMLEDLRLVRGTGFIVNKHSKNAVNFYNGRGMAEQWIKEGKNDIKWTKLSCSTFKDNQA